MFRNSQLQRENGELKGQLKLMRKKFKENERLESTLSQLHIELDQTQSTLQAEISTLRKQVTHSLNIILLYIGLL